MGDGTRGCKVGQTLIPVSGARPTPVSSRLAKTRDAAARTRVAQTMPASPAAPQHGSASTPPPLRRRPLGRGRGKRSRAV